MRALADRLAAVMPPAAAIDLAVSNLSSLDANDVTSVGDRLKAELARRGFRVDDASSAETHLEVTFSEGTDGYLLVGQIRKGANTDTAIFEIAKSEQGGRRAQRVSLEQQLVWQQPGAILDFAFPPAAAGETAEMIVLETGRLAFYTRAGSDWQVKHAVIIPPARPWLRDARGHIDVSQGLANGRADLPGITCKGDFTQPQTIQCGFVSQETQVWIQSDPVLGGTGLGGDAARLALQCDGRSVVLATGKEDWTHTDFIQPYEMEASGQGAAESGNPADFAGPVTALWGGSTAGARAVVHNLKTGNYEAYIVTASCSQ